MVVKRIVSNIACLSTEEVQKFYCDLFDLKVAMDFGWIATLTSEENAPAQISIAQHGGSGTDVPDLSIEVDDVDAAYLRAQQMGLEVNYDLTDEPWGVRRFYVTDPTGKLLNILAHSDK
ncbi:Glyoxalase-like domain-containing protein [Shimia gijangensis]|uniref:Glyoxalase-like domain-containing protein n=1 Tax=Shimia gijangensis TaxID=1470563 RepID=A0A1M6J5F9_9RHOB|nr:VOC family protein [Shimia gijangensis]SHJ41889.1 Glyoxalase-like domain-containing protein [Shimia gijangensis]